MKISMDANKTCTPATHIMMMKLLLVQMFQNIDGKIYIKGILLFIRRSLLIGVIINDIFYVRLQNSCKILVST